MPETPAQTARRRSEERRSFTVRGARPVAAAQESALKQGFTRAPMPAAKVRPARSPDAPMAPRQEPVSAEAMGGARHDPNVEITVGPDGVVRRRRKE